MTRQIISSARRLFRLPTWAVAVAAAFVLGAIVGPMAASAGPMNGASRGAAAPGVAPLKHVFVIMMENTSYDDLLSPSNTNTAFIRQLAANNGLANNYFGVTHVSLPNYIAATSGQTWNSNSDDVAQAPSFDHQNLVDQLEAAGVSWKAYMEDLPFPGDTVTQTPDGLYVRKHDPFLMYPDVYTNPARADKVVPLTQLSTDLSTNRVPQFVWITPNNCNNMHGGAPCLPVPQHTERRQPAGAISGWRQLPEHLGRGHHAQQGVDRAFGHLHHLGRGRFRDVVPVRAYRHFTRAGLSHPARDARQSCHRRRR